ncbi:histidine kinase [Zooshikella sp. RANM57]|uniref:histidine kinase n=1 Tax=Zooshikella sp. RANM57 TaxID=3425863 RepID=UPI003D6E957E
MLQHFQKSITFRMSAIMTMLVLLSLVTIIASYFISESTDQDAEAVNIAGSLRMQSYRLLNVVVRNAVVMQVRQPINQYLDDFNQSLTAPALLQALDDENSLLSKQYTVVKQHWFDDIKRQLEKENYKTPLQLDKLQNKVEVFVEEIDQLVNLYQHLAERKIDTLRLIQIIALFSIVSLAYFSVKILNKHVTRPLQQLTYCARKIGEGDFSQNIDLNHDDELGLLAKTINTMCIDISQMYSHLEQRVTEKTEALNRSNQTLNFLYQVACDINEKSKSHFSFDYWLASLSDVINVDAIDICLKTSDAQIPYEHFSTHSSANTCRPVDCEQCLSAEGNFVTPADCPKIHYPLIKDNNHYGVLVFTLNAHCELEAWQHQVIKSFASQVAVALSLRGQLHQERRMALMNERTVIARELHDSIAQALSYLKIQVTRLKRALPEEQQPPHIVDIVTELREGITSAYQQLRELLTTFRLQIPEQGLSAALEQTVKQAIEQQPNFNINLDYQIHHLPLTPNEEIHLLQLIREAVQNALHHSQGNCIRISLDLNNHQHINISIVDNGIGIKDYPDKLNHYGLAIMRERSRHLKGVLEIKRLKEGGTGVFFEFTPDCLQEKK